MTTLSRFGPSVARSIMYQHSRHMASAATATDPVQKLFVDKVREFKSSKKGLDETNQKAMAEEMARLKRVFNIEDEKKLSILEAKFSPEVDVSIHDIEAAKALRQSITSGEYQKQLAVREAPISDLAASVPEPYEDDLHLPEINKPLSREGFYYEYAPSVPTLGDPEPDYTFVGDKMTPERLQREIRVDFGSDMPTINDDKAPERDTVNFPRIEQNLDTPPTRYHIIPECWFQFFYPKTGVTGPYAFAGGVGTFLLSKEWLIWEHNLLTSLTSTIILTTLVIKFGPQLGSYLKTSVKKTLDSWEEWRLGNIELLNTMTNHYKNELNKRDLIDDIYQMRKQDVQNQLESEYRQRLKFIYDTTKRRLNYLVAKADSQRQISHKNMVDWVISNAVASIGQKQETEVLDNCVSELKKLASKNSSVI